MSTDPRDSIWKALQKVLVERSARDVFQWYFTEVSALSPEYRFSWSGIGAVAAATKDLDERIRCVRELSRVQSVCVRTMAYFCVHGLLGRSEWNRELSEHVPQLLDEVIQASSQSHSCPLCPPNGRLGTNLEGSLAHLVVVGLTAGLMGEDVLQLARNPNPALQALAARMVRALTATPWGQLPWLVVKEDTPEATRRSILEASPEIRATLLRNQEWMKIGTLTWSVRQRRAWWTRHGQDPSAW
jgi:hypothetical protein